MALPKWMIKKENAVLVVGTYAVIFLLMLPMVVVGFVFDNFFDRHGLRLDKMLFCIFLNFLGLVVVEFEEVHQ